ncbi:MAG TPA: exodeoxyribonuclease VII large subunit, partial [Candidatus Methanoperedens sp.]
IAVPDRHELRNHVFMLRERIIDIQRRKIDNDISYVLDLRAGVDPVLLLEKLAQYDQNVDESSRRQNLSMLRILEARIALFVACSGKLDAVSPLGTLCRGYSIALKLPEKIPVCSTHDVEKSDNIQVIVKDGKIKCSVVGKEGCEWK